MFSTKSNLSSKIVLALGLALVAMVFALTQVSAQTITIPLVLNEIDPDPVSGLQADEFIEIFNPNNVAVDAGGYKIQTQANRSAGLYTIPAGTMIPALGVKAFLGADTGLDLECVDRVTLADVANSPTDTFFYGSCPDAGFSWGRPEAADGSGQWLESCPTPDGLNDQEPCEPAAVSLSEIGTDSAVVMPLVVFALVIASMGTIAVVRREN